MRLERNTGVTVCPGCGLGKGGKREGGGEGYSSVSPWVRPAHQGTEGPALARIPVWQAGDRNWAPNHRKDDSREQRGHRWEEPTPGRGHSDSHTGGFNSLGSILFYFYGGFIVKYY